LGAISRKGFNPLGFEKMAMRPPRLCAWAFVPLTRIFVIPGRQTPNPSARNRFYRQCGLFDAGG